VSKFNVGDRVRIKSYEKMLSQYEKDHCGIQLPFSRFDDGMKHLCGRTATICKIDEKNNEKVYLKDWDDDAGDKDFTFSIYMLEKVREYKTFNFIDDTMDTSKRNVVGISYPNTVQPIFKLSEGLQKSLDTMARDTIDELNNEAIDDTKKWFKGKPVVSMDDDSIDAFRYFINELRAIDNFFENKEEKDMNKVVNLWYERNRDKIVDKYKEKEIEFYNNKYSIVESFNELVDTFNNNLEDLYKLDKATEQFVLKENAPTNVVKYCIDLDKLKEEFEVEYLIKRNEELKEIEDIKEEVEAQLSLSDDLEYQQEVLKRYNIIDKKTNKIVG